MPQTPRILIIEDHPAIRNMLISLFKNGGYEITAAADGAMGFQYAMEGGFYTILLDLKMPQMDGFEFMKRIKITPPKTSNGPIIVFSSHSYDYAKKQALELGAADFILKDDLESIHLVEHVESIVNKVSTPVA